jgi:hypothetical protein
LGIDFSSVAKYGHPEPCPERSEWSSEGSVAMGKEILRCSIRCAQDKAQDDNDGPDCCTPTVKSLWKYTIRSFQMCKEKAKIVSKEWAI